MLVKKFPKSTKSRFSHALGQLFQNCRTKPIGTGSSIYIFMAIHGSIHMLVYLCPNVIEFQLTWHTITLELSKIY